jgi:hypothetical protein
MTSDSLAKMGSSRTTRNVRNQFEPAKSSSSDPSNPKKKKKQKMEAKEEQDDDDLSHNVSLLDFFTGASNSDKVMLGFGVFFSLISGVLISVPLLFLMQLVFKTLEPPEGKSYSYLD